VRYDRLGTTGVRVSSQCLGAMMFGRMGNPDHDDCVRMINHALDSGINFIDTADAYSQGESEEIVGKAIAGRRDEVVLATKFFNKMGDDPNRRGGSRRWIVQAVEDSLRRLGTDRIDLYQSHRLDFNVELDETLGALSDLIRQGKVLYIGSSSYPAPWIVEAQWVAQRGQRERFVCEQPQYSIFARSAEAAVLPTCLRHDIAVIPWSPLAGGWLAGKYRRDNGIREGTRFGPDGIFARAGAALERTNAVDERYELIDRLEALSEQCGLPLVSLALGFVAEHPAITSTIIGPRTREQLDAALAACDVRLDAASLDAIDEIVPPGTDIAGIDHLSGDPALRPGARRRART
jgi:aryl-alcohol dehydrogenase-like predicted oxidoreductase